MKKSYLMIAAVAALFAACSENEEIKQISSQGPAIGFTTYYQKATRATENSSENYSWDLSNHHSTFKVWGYKNTSETAVFNGEQVWWDTSLDPDAWTYTNNRYWDKVADDYYFYACAPYTGTPFSFNGVTSVATQPDGYFTIETAYTKAGENVSAYAKSTADPKVASENMVESWTAAGAETDIDLMIAETKHMAKGTTLVYDDPVQLNFIHVLSRLNITVKTVDGFDPDEAEDDIIVVDKIIIGNMKKSGTFEENKSLEDGELVAGTYKRWTTSAVENDAVYSYNLDYTADLDKKYVIEALMLPQPLEVETVKADGSDIASKTKPYLYIEYTIWNHAKSAGQTYKAYYNLATILTVTSTNTTATATAFNEGWQNNIYITIDPDKIDFEAKVAKWATTNENDLIVD